MTLSKGSPVLRGTISFALAVAAWGQTASFHEDTLHGRRAFVLENDRMRISTLPGGGFIGEIRFKSDDPKKSVNPMRVPDYQTIDPFAYDIAKHGSIYGTGMQRRLMSGYMGHFLCFPHFGPSSQAELSYDYGQHGEALAVEWKQQKVDVRRDGVTLWYSADLPKTQFRVERAITLPADETVGYVEESVENLVPYDRPVQWVQHVTFGPPFLELGKSYVDAPIDRATRSTGRSGPSLSEASWTSVKNAKGDATDLRVFTGTGGIWLMDRSRPKIYFTLYNTDYPVLIGYIFPSTENPWVLDWQANREAAQAAKQQALPGGRTVARGICIGDSPIQGLRIAIDRGSMLGVPVYSWIQARQRKTQTYVFFLAEIPFGFKGVADLRVESGQIVIVERETGKRITVKSTRLL